MDAELSAQSYPRLIWGDNYLRLQAVKTKYDPGDLFRYPQSVKLAKRFVLEFDDMLTVAEQPAGYSARL